jgi:hypothetical protein
MAPKPQIYFAGVLYHVISRSNWRQVIFRAVAEHFHRDPAGISQGMHKLEVRLRREGVVQGAVKGIEETLTRNGRRKYLITYA